VAWQHGVLRYVTRRKVTIIALSNKYDKRVYKVRKLSAFVWDYPFQLDDFEKMIFIQSESKWQILIKIDICKLKYF
jgi:hypothetical protein